MRHEYGGSPLRSRIESVLSRRETRASSPFVRHIRHDNVDYSVYGQSVEGNLVSGYWNNTLLRDKQRIFGVITEDNQMQWITANTAKHQDVAPIVGLDMTDFSSFVHLTMFPFGEGAQIVLVSDNPEHAKTVENAINYFKRNFKDTKEKIYLNLGYYKADSTKEEQYTLLSEYTL